MLEGRLENENRINYVVEKLLTRCPSHVKEWNNYLSANGKTAASRKDYVYKIMKFLEYINPDIRRVSPKSITAENVTSYMISIRTKETNGGTTETSGGYRQGIYSALKNYLHFLSKRGYIAYNYMEDIAYPKSNDLERINKRRVLLSEEDFVKILNEAKKEDNDFLRYRDICILSLLMTTGMRETALLSINIEDIDFENEVINVIDKGDKMFEYPLKENIIHNIHNWLEIRGGSQEGALFISKFGERMSPLSISNVTKKYSYRALGMELSAHKFRAGFASITYKNNPDILFVQRAMGHSFSSTTQRYVVTDNKEREIASSYIAGLFD